ncbi:MULTISPECIES: hypothetical protein [Halomonadaceae]|uniref:hypothetical protein n=1 Tax=Halomonadaceae TaxID=28256 RepID=UPI001583E14C|nr:MULTISPECIES: hypothetical protein [Halomonas]MDI4636972.1 hypothetical protein [Halomonas sp. BMC7]NUJ58139.1 hypothetical protein [Halomonas taeanensis]
MPILLSQIVGESVGALGSLLIALPEPRNPQGDPTRHSDHRRHGLLHSAVGVVPFVGLQVLAVALVFLFPGIATWLPQAIGW